MTDARNSFSFQSLVEDAIQLLRDHPLPLLLPLVLVGALTGGGPMGVTLGLGPGGFDRGRSGFDLDFDPPWFLVGPIVALVVLLAALFLLVVLALNGLAALVTASAALTAAHGGAPDLGAAWEGMRHRLMGGLLTYILFSVLVIAGIVLLVAPGAFLLGALAPWYGAFAAEGLTGPAALRRGWALTEGRRLPLFLLMLLTLVAAFAAKIGVGWMPFMGEALAGAAGGAIAAFQVAVGVIVYARATRPAEPPAAGADPAP